jgi:predicted Zn-dependent peptidase
MRFRNLFQKFAVLLVCAIFAVGPAFSQKPGSTTPRQEKLLNGLKVLMWTDPAAPDVKVSIRIHSGSAFDPQGKEGLMQLLADNIFPNAPSKAFFSEDLGGGVEVITNYDYIQVNAWAKPDQFVTLLETLAQAVSNPVIDRETTAELKKALAERLAVLEKDPVYVADLAASKRLFGTFPYGRPQLGSTESLQRIDFADLTLARERFLSADNATVAISGNYNGDLGFRAARRYFGAWLKSDKRVPSTFRQPDAPDTKPLEISVAAPSGRTSFALRGLARNDPDYPASVIFANILRSRAEKGPAGITVSHQARVLPGVVMVSAPGSALFPFALFSERISEAEFTRARSEVAAEFSKRSLVDRWLDSDTYRIQPAPETPAWQSVTLSDVQRVADRLAKNPIASVIVTPAA